MKILDLRKRKDIETPEPPVVRRKDLKDMERDESRITADLEALTKELERLNSHRYIRVHNSMFRLILFNLVRGLAFGLGSVFGATIIVSLVAYFLNQMDFVPFVGEWAKGIAADIMSNTQRVETGE